MNKRRLYPAAAASLLTLFLACEMMGPEPKAAPGPDGKALVRIGIEAQGFPARTILPQVALSDVTIWKLRGGKSEEGETETHITDFPGTNTTATVYLEPGNWHFTLTGYKDEAPILRGTLSETVAFEGSNNLNFIAVPILEGSGTFTVTINLPPGHGITTVKVWKDGEEQTPPLTPDSNSVAFEEETLAAGDYYFRFYLYRDSDLYGVLSELVQVRQNLGSEKTYTLALADLNRTYLISYDLNGGGGVTTPGYYHTTDAALTLPEPTRTGYIFGGWYTDPGCNGTEITEITQGETGDKNFYAKWESYTYTVNFDKNGGDAEADPAVKIVASPATTTGALPGTPPSRGGYSFAGWYTQQDGGGTAFTGATTVNSDTTVYAKWELLSSGVIILKLDGGDKAFTQETFTVYKSGGTGSKTISLTGGYSNPRWEVDGDPKTPDNETGGITINAADYTPGNHTLSLRAVKDSDGIIWSKEISFTVEAGTLRTVLFRSNNGTGAIYALKTLTAGVSLGGGFPTPPSRTGYDFTGWYTAASGGTAFTNTTPVSEDTTVYAQWNPKTYTVTFNLNYEGAGPDITKTVTVPDETISPGAFPGNPTRGGYNFAGWSTAADSFGTAFEQTTPVAGDITVYAQWSSVEFNITLKLEDAGNDALTPGTAFTLSKSGGTVSQTLDIAGEGYTKPRWFVDGDPKTPPDPGTSITINAADYSLGKHYLTLLVSKRGVSWSKEISFTVEAGTLRTVLFRSNNGTGAIYALKTLTVGGSLGGGFPTPPTRTGYDFTGWYTAASGGTAFTNTTPVSEDTTVYAQWNPKTYTVTFNLNYEGATPDPYGTATVTVPDETINPGAFPTPPSRPDYNFAGWNTEADGSGRAFGQTTPVAGDITVYAQWAHTSFNISLKLEDAGNDALTQSDFILSKGGGATREVSLAGTGYTNPRWFVDGDPKTPPGPGTSITINAADYSLGKHYLTLLVSKRGVSWSKEIIFTVTN